MNRYYKDIEGTRVWYKGVIVKNEKQIFTWDEELILADGWTKYVSEPHIPTLEELKAAKVAEIEAYDASPAVNEFFIGNQALWLDKDTRVGLNFSLAMEESTGATESTLWYDNICFTLPIAQYKAMLVAVEMYAKQCYNVTAQHKANVLALETKEEVEAYDYTGWYPEKVNF